jgi:hypothetical protein
MLGLEKIPEILKRLSAIEAQLNRPKVEEIDDSVTLLTPERDEALMERNQRLFSSRNQQVE